MTDIQLLTIVLTLLAIFGSTFANRKSVEDMRDVLRAEMKAQVAELNLTLKEQTADLKATLLGIANKLDHLAEMVATHGERLDKLDGRK